MNRVWICGQYKSGEFLNTVWDLQGIFSTREKAVAACRNENYFIAPVTVDEVVPDETTSFPGVEYPLSGGNR